jgi:hypothetical protein
MMIRFEYTCLALLCSLLSLAPLALAGPARATTLLRMSIEKMSQTAPLIVRARCLENSAGWDSGEIWTLTSFEVEETWRGSASQQITVRLLGGTVGNLNSSIPGVPRFRQGEEVVLFLEPTARGDFSIVSWQQGTFRVHRELHSARQSVTQDTASFETFDPSARRFETAGIRNMALDILKLRVAAALQQTAGRKP